jgi:ParB/RepB/Spo0J family partition protein
MDISSSYRELSLDIVDPNPNQPRQSFDEAKIQKLAVSIKKNTQLQAITVRPHPSNPGRYMIVAGERRFRALRENGIKRATFKVYEGKDVAKSYILSAIENIQREALNPIEEALCYQRLHDEEYLTWEEVATELGIKDVGKILAKIKLLTLPPEIQQRVRDGTLPQVTALNLSHHQNDEGAYMRMAHDLIAGRDSAEVHFSRETIRGQQQVQARMPKTPEEFAVRIVKLSGLVQSMPAVLEAFMRLPSNEQVRAFEVIHSSVRGKLRVRFVALYRAIQAVSERMNAFDAHHAGRGPALEESVPELVHETAVQSPASAPNIAAPADVLKSVAATRQPASKPTAQVRSTEPLAPPPATPKSQPLIRAHGNGYTSPASAGTPGKQNIEISHRVLLQLFYSGGFRRVDLSRAKLRNNMGSDGEPQDLVRNALNAAKGKWRVAPQGSEQEQKFILLVSKLRFDFGDPDKFDDFLLQAKREDKSHDPVSLQ